MKRFLIAGIVSALLIPAAGCGLLCGLLSPCGPCGSCGPVAAGPCMTGCGGECDTDGGASCPSVCADPCDDECAGGCGPVCREACCQRGPLSFVFRLFTAGTWRDKGCGELYCGDWYADAGEPCDGCGNYVGACSHCDGGPIGGPAPMHGGAAVISDGAPAGPCPHCNKAPGAHSAKRSSPSARGYASQRRPSNYARHGKPSNMAPRLISQTDRIVAPAEIQASRVVAADEDQQPRRTARRPTTTLQQ